MNAIEVINVTKSYRIYKHPADRLKEILLRKRYHQLFEALQHISLTVPQGGILGVVGDNGAGKSTLLKLLAGTLSPSSGKVTVNGRTAALLELGAGFHPEFTGRENIKLNAALMGLTPGEIGEREQEIIDFSELHDFIDRIVKTYSTGMYMRLGFSIAATVDPDVLIVDEALSVGDAHFQNKCIERMIEFKNRGKTILFCSHSMHLIRLLCNSAMWLHEGSIKAMGEVNMVVDGYLNHVRGKNTEKITIKDIHHFSNERHSPVWVEKVTIKNFHGEELETIESGSDIALHIEIGATDGIERLCCIGVAINKADKLPVFGATSIRDGLNPVTLYNGKEIVFHFPDFSLLGGGYNFLVALLDDHCLHIYDQYHSQKIEVTCHTGESGIVSFHREWSVI